MSYLKTNPDKIIGYTKEKFGNIDDLEYTNKFKVNFERQDSNNLIVWINIVNKNDQSKVVYIKTILPITDLEFDQSKNAFFTQDTQIGIIASKLDSANLENLNFTLTDKLK